MSLLKIKKFIMRKYLLIFLLFFVTTPVFAANTSGNAWSESLGWFNFSNATISDTAVTGYAYNDNTGWLVLEGITNTNGTLSGYAWSESVGYFDFSNVIITNGTFSGYAYNDNTGWLSFESPVNVTTTWAPAEDTPPPVKKSSTGTSIQNRVENLNKMGKTDQAENLKKQYPNLFKTSSAPTLPISNNPRDLELNSTGDDVKALQQFLNSQGFLINANGLPGSTGNETTYFGNLTKQALIKFQQANNITPSLGYYGPKTKAFIKTLSITN